jgi:uncharacterized protein
MTARLGHWMKTRSGRVFYPIDPRPEDIDIGDIAHALSFVCRFGGHVPRFYSVAEHSVRVALAIEASGASSLASFAGLLHDASEAYLGDVVWPLKRAEGMAGYRAIEKNLERVIALRFGLPSSPTPNNVQVVGGDEIARIVKHFDLVLLSTEKRDLMSEGDGIDRQVDDVAREAAAEPWHSDHIAPLEERIEPWTSEQARWVLLKHFDRLRPAWVPPRSRFEP